jgi:hypothetical protein
MKSFSKGKSLTDPDVIKLSQNLDILIDKYLKAYRQQNVVYLMPERDRQRAEAF